MYEFRYNIEPCNLFIIQHTWKQKNLSQFVDQTIDVWKQIYPSITKGSKGINTVFAGQKMTRILGLYTLKKGNVTIFLNSAKCFHDFSICTLFRFTKNLWVRGVILFIVPMLFLLVCFFKIWACKILVVFVTIVFLFYMFICHECVDINAILLHEIGHMLGLKHVYDRDAIMNINYTMNTNCLSNRDVFEFNKLHFNNSKNNSNIVCEFDDARDYLDDALIFLFLSLILSYLSYCFVKITSEKKDNLTEPKIRGWILTDDIELTQNELKQWIVI